MFKAFRGAKSEVPKTKKPFISAKERIEAWPDITKAEMIWFRTKAGELKALDGIARKAKECSYSGRPYGFRSDIHTHILETVEGMWGASLPSIDDLKTTAMLVAESCMSAWHIASIDNDGKVAGYVSYAATGKFIQLADDNGPWTWGLLNHVVFKGQERQRTVEEKRKFLQHMLSEKLIRLHITPMPGYKFDLENGLFVKARFAPGA